MPLFITLICLLVAISRKNVYGDSPSTIDIAEYNILSAVYDLFAEKLKDEKEEGASDQFAVIYYGSYQAEGDKGSEVNNIINNNWATCKNVNGGKYFLNKPKTDFDAGSCCFVAGRETKGYHSETTTVWSFRSTLDYKYEDYDQCPKPAYPPKVKNAYAKLYMVTKSRPCTCCADNILKFAQKCINTEEEKGAYTHLIVGYKDQVMEVNDDAAQAFERFKDYASLVWINPGKVNIQKPEVVEEEKEELAQKEEKIEPSVEKKVKTDL